MKLPESVSGVNNDHQKTLSDSLSVMFGLSVGIVIVFLMSKDIAKYEIGFSIFVIIAGILMGFILLLSVKDVFFSYYRLRKDNNIAIIELMREEQYKLLLTELESEINNDEIDTEVESGSDAEYLIVMNKLEHLIHHDH